MPGEIGGQNLLLENSSKNGRKYSTEGDSHDPYSYSHISNDISFRQKIRKIEELPWRR